MRRAKEVQLFAI